MSDFFAFSQKITLKPLESYPKEVRAKLPGVVKKNAQVLKAMTKTSQNMPVDTGALRDSIEEYPTDQPLTREVMDGVEYGVYQEQGTGRGITAKHFLAGAAEALADKFFDEVKDALK